MTEYSFTDALYLQKDLGIILHYNRLCVTSYLECCRKSDMRQGKYYLTIVVIGAIGATLLTAAIPSVYAQTTTGDTNDPDNFAGFINCLFDGTGEAASDDTAQNVVDAIEGTAQSVPTEQDIRDCFEPIYEPAGTAAGPATGPSTLEPTTGVTDGEDEEEDDTNGESEGEDEEGTD